MTNTHTHIRAGVWPVTGGPSARRPRDISTPVSRACSSPYGSASSRLPGNISASRRYGGAASSCVRGHGSSRPLPTPCARCRAKGLATQSQQEAELQGWHLLMEWSQRLWRSCSHLLLGDCDGVGGREAGFQGPLSLWDPQGPPTRQRVLLCGQGTSRRSHVAIGTQDKEGPCEGTGAHWGSSYCLPPPQSSCMPPTTAGLSLVLLTLGAAQP